MGRNGRKLGTVCAGAFIATAYAPIALAGGITAGTLIENTATATFGTGGTTTSVDSNTVTLRVDEVLDVTVVSKDAAPIAVKPGAAVLTYEVTNTGNGPEAFDLTATPSVSGNDFDSTVVSVAVDSNGNGVYDPGVDAILSGAAKTAELDPDDNVTVFVLVTVPVGPVDAAASKVDLLAVASTGSGAPGTTFAAAGVSGSDAIVGSTGADDDALGALIFSLTTVELVKSASIADPFGGSAPIPGSIVTFTIAVNTSGSGEIDNLVVTDAIPSGTTYVPASLALDAAEMTDASGDDAGEASPAGISIDLGTVPGGRNYSITFDVEID